MGRIPKVPKSGEVATVALGATVLAALASFVIVVLAFEQGFARQYSVTRQEAPGCAHPVEIFSEGVSWLGCRSNPELSECAALKAGDRVVLTAHSCLREEEGMSGAFRLVSQLPLLLNRVSSAELALLPGIGPKLSRAIVKHREKVGGYGRVEDLLGVRGIGKKKLMAWQGKLACTRP